MAEATVAVLESENAKERRAASGTRVIIVSGGREVVVDERDFDLVSAHKWRSVFRSTNWYAMTDVRVSRGKRVTVYMHRLIMGAKPGQEVDHINGNGLDNRRCNLRFCTCTENKHNSWARGGTSRFRGVHKKVRRPGWQAAIRHNGVFRHLGVFENEVEAAKAYDEAAKQLHGRFARLNFPDEGPSAALIVCTECEEMHRPDVIEKCNCCQEPVCTGCDRYIDGKTWCPRCVDDLHLLTDDEAAVWASPADVMGSDKQEARADGDF